MLTFNSAIESYRIVCLCWCETVWHSNNANTYQGSLTSLTFPCHVTSSVMWPFYSP